MKVEKCQFSKVLPQTILQGIKKSSGHVYWDAKSYYHCSYLPYHGSDVTYHGSYITYHNSYLTYHCSYLTLLRSYLVKIPHITQKLSQIFVIFYLPWFISYWPQLIPFWTLPRNIHIFLNTPPETFIFYLTQQFILYWSS